MEKKNYLFEYKARCGAVGEYQAVSTDSFSAVMDFREWCNDVGISPAYIRVNQVESFDKKEGGSNVS